MYASVVAMVAVPQYKTLHMYSFSHQWRDVLRVCLALLGMADMYSTFAPSLSVKFPLLSIQVLSKGKSIPRHPGPGRGGRGEYLSVHHHGDV